MKKIFITLFLFVCLSANAVEKKTNFSIDIFEKAKASGKTVVINSYEVWCGTCSKQTKVLDQAEKEFKDMLKNSALNFGQLLLFTKGMTRLLV